MVHLWVHDFPFPKVGYAGDERMKPQCLTWGLTSLKLLEILPPKFEAHERVILLSGSWESAYFSGMVHFLGSNIFFSGKIEGLIAFSTYPWTPKPWKMKVLIPRNMGKMTVMTCKIEGRGFSHGTWLQMHGRKDGESSDWVSVWWEHLNRNLLHIHIFGR